MKFIHCADLHIDSKMETLPAEKTKIRREEILHTFERLVSFAKENGVTAVIIAGDTFDVAKVSSKTKKRVLYAIENAPEVDFLYLAGNHDEDGFISALDYAPENLKFFGNGWTYFNYGNVTVCGADAANGITDLYYDTLKLSAERKNIVVLHGQTAEYKSKEKSALISIPRLKNKNIDYLALGHIHSFSEGVIDERGKYAYCGCPDGRGFDETGEKGFVLIETDSGAKLRYNFVPFASRNLFTFEYDVSGGDNWYADRERLLSVLKESFPRTALLKVALKGEHKADYEIDIDSLVSRLNEYFFFAKVYDRTELQISESDCELDKSVKGEFVRAVLKSNLDNLTKKRVIMCGINALKGEDF